jgi:hypothetical protein
MNLLGGGEAAERDLEGLSKKPAVHEHILRIVTNVKR